MYKTVVAVLFLLAFSASAQVESFPLPLNVRGTGLVFSPDGTGWISTLGGTVFRFEPGQPPAAVPGFSATIIAVAADGTVWGGQGSTVSRLDPDTDAVTSFGAGASVAGLAAGNDGLLWLITRNDFVLPRVHRLVRMDLAGNVVSSVVVDLLVGAGIGAVAVQDQLWLPGTSVIRLSASGVKQVTPLPISPIVALPADDFVWVTVDSQRVMKLSTTGAILLDVALVGGTDVVGGAAVDGEGNLWAVSLATGMLYRITPDGAVTTQGVFPKPQASCLYFYGQTFMAFAPDGRLALLETVADLTVFPGEPCPTEPVARDTLVLIDLEAHGAPDVPALGMNLLIGLAALLAIAGALRAGTP